MAYFVRNASKIAFKRIKIGFFIERFAKICLSKNISHNIKFFYTKAWFMYLKCAILFLQKQKRPKVGKLSLKTV
jgi:hypothetical protein